ncbi:MAG: hypothetical protein ACSW8D_03290 [Prevotella sp.]
MLPRSVCCEQPVGDCLNEICHGLFASVVFAEEVHVCDGCVVRLVHQQGQLRLWGSPVLHENDRDPVSVDHLALGVKQLALAREVALEVLFAFLAAVEQMNVWGHQSEVAIRPHSESPLG